MFSERWPCSCVNFLPPPDDIAFLQVAHDLYLQNSKYPEALALAIRLFDPKLIADDFHAAGNPYVFRPPFTYSELTATQINEKSNSPSSSHEHRYLSHG